MPDVSREQEQENEITQLIDTLSAECTGENCNAVICATFTVLTRTIGIVRGGQGFPPLQPDDRARLFRVVLELCGAAAEGIERAVQANMQNWSLGTQ